MKNNIIETFKQANEESKLEIFEKTLEGMISYERLYKEANGRDCNFYTKFIGNLYIKH